MPSGWNPAYSFDVTLTNAEDSFDVACATQNNCRMMYQRDYTPLLVDMTPSNVYYGQYVQYHVNPKFAHTKSATPTGDPQVKAMRIGNYLVDTNSTLDDGDRLDQF
jgi:hypothetical protein